MDRKDRMRQVMYKRRSIPGFRATVFKTRKLPTVFSLFCCLHLAGVSSAANSHGSVALPTGWREPTREELQESWRDELSNRGAMVVGDFDGDSIHDYASIALDESTREWALLVSLSSSNHDWLILEAGVPGELVMAVEVLRPGEHKVLCSDQEMAGCGPSGKRSISPLTDSIGYYRFASAGSVFVWDSDSRQFSRFWDSD